MISNKSKWKCNSGWYVHLYSVVYAAQQQGGYHPPFKLRGKLVLLLLLLGFEIFYQKPCRWFDPLFQCVCILKKISLLISSLAAKNHTPWLEIGSLHTCVCFVNFRDTRTLSGMSCYTQRSKGTVKITDANLDRVFAKKCLTETEFSKLTGPVWQFFQRPSGSWGVLGSCQTRPSLHI